MSSIWQASEKTDRGKVPVPGGTVIQMRNYAYVDPCNTRCVLLYKEFGFPGKKLCKFHFSRIKRKLATGITVGKIKAEGVSEPHIQNSSWSEN